MTALAWAPVACFVAFIVVLLVYRARGERQPEWVLPVYTSLIGLSIGILIGQTLARG